ncbi:MAG TPA: V-type ATP synthase subunit D [Candidatus Dormibacteraeota bacterium]|nr:V-type ATP synthase subunit D [Candidatus Dormibacteraeota bacterium]
MPDRIPPGRAGRLWLVDRLAAARRGVELLDRKRQLLRREESRLALLRDETARRWAATCGEAERWDMRSGELGGAADLAVAARTVTARAQVEVTWRNTMGVRHPDEPRTTLPTLAPAELAAGNAALRPAAAAYRRALEAAVTHAVTDAAHGRVAAELRATQRRLRGIERHRVPTLEEALRRLQLRLDELEREERVVTRWAQRRQPARGRRKGGRR